VNQEQQHQTILRNLQPNDRIRVSAPYRIYKAREEVQLALAREGITFGARAEEAELAGAEIVA